MDDIQDWEDHFMSRARPRRNTEGIWKKHGLIIIQKGDLLKETSCVEGRVVSEQEDNLEKSKAELKREKVQTGPIDIELSTVPSKPEGVSTVENKEGIIHKRKRSNTPTAKEISKLKRRDIFSD